MSGADGAAGTGVWPTPVTLPTPGSKEGWLDNGPYLLNLLDVTVIVIGGDSLGGLDAFIVLQ